MPAPVPCATCATNPTSKQPGETVLVTGPPCAGKTSYVAEHATPGDLVIDFDRISQSVGSPNSHGHPDPLKPFVWDAVEAMVARLETGRHNMARSWVIKCAPDPTERTRFAERTGARIVVLETSADECKTRAAATGRPNEWDALIDEWWTTYGAETPTVTPSTIDVEIVTTAPRDGAEHNKPRDGATPTNGKGHMTDTANTAAPDEPRDGDNDATTPEPDAELTSLRVALKKANKEAETSRARLKDIEDRDKTEHQKLAEKVAGFEATATAAQLTALRYEVALEKGLPKTLAVRLQGSTVEEMEADADALLSVTAAPKQKPPSFDGGPRTSAPAADQDMTSRIRQQLGRT